MMGSRLALETWSEGSDTVKPPAWYDCCLTIATPAYMELPLQHRLTLMPHHACGERRQCGKVEDDLEMIFL
jgi:hypothetical protein